MQRYTAKYCLVTVLIFPLESSASIVFLKQFYSRWSRVFSEDNALEVNGIAFKELNLTTRICKFLNTPQLAVTLLKLIQDVVLDSEASEISSNNILKQACLNLDTI